MRPLSRTVRLPGRSPHRTAARDLTRRARRLALTLLTAVLALAVLPARVQAQRPIDFGMTYTQERTKFVGGPADKYFYLRGATVDVNFDLYKGLGISANGTGLAATNLESNIDIHHIEFLAGPRYTYNLGHISDLASSRRGGIFIEGKAGYTFATAGIYPINGVNQDHASALTYEGGGGINVTLYRRFDLRLIEANHVRTQLPNGGTNQQNTLRLASGVNFHFGR